MLGAPLVGGTFHSLVSPSILNVFAAGVVQAGIGRYQLAVYTAGLRYTAATEVPCRRDGLLFVLELPER
jgi:hypothetical protein